MFGRRELQGAIAASALLALIPRRARAGEDQGGEAPSPVSALRPEAPRLSPLSLTLTGPGNVSRSLDSLRGKPFLLHVWATWCVPCRHELPLLNALLEKLGRETPGSGPPVVPAAVASGAPEKIAAFLRAAKLGEIPAWSLDSKAFRVWLGAADLAVPATLLIDGQGRLRAEVQGEVDWGAADAASRLREVLAAS